MGTSNCLRPPDFPPEKKNMFLQVFLLFSCLAAISGHEDCPIACPFNLDPVCGSDGVSYANFCVFISTQCEQENEGNSIYLAGVPMMRGGNGVGECLTSFADLDEASCDISCPRPGVGGGPICGSDGRSYDDRCSFEVQRCKAKVNNSEFTKIQCSRKS